MRFFILIAVSLFSINTFSQTSFPESWVGKYEGNLEIYSVDSIAMNLKMNLDILKTEKDSLFQWIITYNIKGNLYIRKHS